MKAKLLRNAGRIEHGEAVDIVAKAERDDSESREPSEPEYKVRDGAGHEESVATHDLKVVP